MEPPSGGLSAQVATAGNRLSVDPRSKVRCLCVCVHTSVQGSIQNCALSTPSTGKESNSISQGRMRPLSEAAEALT